MTKHVKLDKLIDMPIREQIGRAKYIPEKERKEKFGQLKPGSGAGLCRTDGRG